MRSTCRSQAFKTATVSQHFRRLSCWKRARGGKHQKTYFAFRSQSGKSTTCSDRFWKLNLNFSWQVQWILHLAKSDKPCAFYRSFNNNDRREAFEEEFRMAGAVQETSSFEMLEGQDADFIRGVAFWSIRSPGLLKWFCVTGAALRMTWPNFYFFVAGAILETHGVEKSQNALVRGRRLHSNCHFWRKSRRIASFLFWPCQFRKMKKPRRIYSF